MRFNLPTAATTIAVISNPNSGHLKFCMQASIPREGCCTGKSLPLSPFCLSLSLSSTSHRKLACDCQTPDAYLVSSRQVANGENNADTAPKTCIFTDNEAYSWAFWKSSDVCIFLRSYPSYWGVYCQQALSVELAYCPVCERSPLPPIFGRQCDKLTTPQNENSSPNGELPATSGDFLTNNIRRSTGLEPNH
jgi:hypothetical protein